MGIQYRHPFNEGWFIPNDGEWGNTASWRSYPPHAGVDYNVVGGSSGKTIRAIAAGTIQSKGWSGTYGNRVYIHHDDGMWSHYAHMLSPSSKNNGDRVNLGDPIGLVGNTGSASSGAHLHLEVATSQAACNNGNLSIDPIQHINNNTNPTPPEMEDPVPTHQSTDFGLQVRLVAERLSSDGGSVVSTSIQPASEIPASATAGSPTHGQHVQPYQLGGPMRFFVQVMALELVSDRNTPAQSGKPGLSA